MVCCCAMAGTKACMTCPSNSNQKTMLIQNDSIAVVPQIYEIPLILPPTDEAKIRYDNEGNPICGNCDGELSTEDLYCRNCGKKLIIDLFELEKLLIWRS